MTAGMAHIKKHGQEAAGPGVNSAFDNIRDTVGPLESDLRSLVNESLNDIRSTGFIPADRLISNLTQLVVQGRGLVGNIFGVVRTTDNAFQELENVFAQLSEIANANNIDAPVPSASDVPNVTADTQPLLGSANSSLTDFNYQIGNLSLDIDDVKAQINDSSPTVQDIYNTINDTVGTLMDNVDSYQRDYNDYEVEQKIDDYYAWVILSNKIRLPVMIILLAIPIILTGLWFIGACTSAYKLMLVGFWWAAAICWLMMILAAVHIVLFVPLNDMCNQKEDLIIRGLNDFVWTNGTNYASVIGIDSPQEAVDAVNVAIGRAMANPEIVLNCKDEESLVTLLEIDVPAIIDIEGKFQSAKDDVREKADGIDINTTIADAQPVFRTIYNGMDAIAQNTSLYNEQLRNFSELYTDFTTQFNVSSLWNSTAESNATTQLNEINNYIATHSPPYGNEVYTYETVDQFNPNNATSPQDRQVLTARRTALLELIRLNNTAKNVTALMSSWDQIMLTLDSQLVQIEDLVFSGRTMIRNGWLLVNESGTIPDQVVATCFEVLDNAVLRANTIADVPELGKCAFIGNFVRRGINQGACRETRSMAGGVAICIFLLAILWLISWPCILSSKTHYAEDGGSHHKDNSFYESDMRKSAVND